MTMENTNTELASKIIDTALFVLQTREFTEQQQQTLVIFIQESVQISAQVAESVVARELHPKYRDVLSFSEKIAFEFALNNSGAYQDEDSVPQSAESYADNWSIDSLRNFMPNYGQSTSLALLELLLRLIKDEQDAQKQHMQLVRVYDVCQLVGIDKWLVSAFFYKYGFYSSSPDSQYSVENDDFILIGSGGACDLVLFDPRVEPLHVYLQKDGERLVLQAEQSKRPVWFKDVPIQRMLLSNMDEFQIGSYLIRFDEQYLKIVDRSSTLSLSVQSVNRKIGGVTLLEDVNFTIFGGELIALIGPSGCGKTTLLNAINGVAPADSGKVLYNGVDFHKLLEQDRSLIGIVPQDDLVLPELTVEEALYYSGCLRLPVHSSHAEIQAEVERVLQELDILHIRNSRIGDALKRGISGGQRKRVNLGQELISRSTRVLFLDEPTSGLDPRASQDIVKLVRGLADKGRIIFLVTHDLTDGIINQVDNLLAMVKGGRLAFFGEKNSALRFFNVPTTDKIFQQFGEDQGKWAKQYKERVDYNLRQKAINEFITTDSASSKPAQQNAGFALFWKQFLTLTERYRKVKLRDTTGMLVIALQPPFLAFVMWIVFQYEDLALPTESMIFMLALSCLWFGMSAAVRELIADQVIFKRERRVGVGVLPYVLSKVVVLGVITAAQTCFLSTCMYFLMDMGNANSYAFVYSNILLVSALTGWVGMGLGLFVSSLWKSSEAAVGSLPLILIPQIAFSSVMFSIRDMSWLSKLITWFVIQRYTFDAFLKCGEKLATRTRKGDFEPQLVNGTLWRLGLKTSDRADDIGFLLWELNGILGAITLAMLLLTVWRVHSRDID